MIHHSAVKVLSSQVGVSSGGAYFKDAVFDRKDGDIEGTSTKIEDDDVPLGFILKKEINIY